MTETWKPLPKNAAVCAQFVRCGRLPCRCDTGRLHGPYWYLFWRERGRLRKRYVPREEATTLHECLKARRNARDGRRDQLRTASEALANLGGALRSVEATWRN